MSVDEQEWMFPSMQEQGSAPQRPPPVPTLNLSAIPSVRAAVGLLEKVESERSQETGRLSEQSARDRKAGSPRTPSMGRLEQAWASIRNGHWKGGSPRSPNIGRLGEAQLQPFHQEPDALQASACRQDVNRRSTPRRRARSVPEYFSGPEYFNIYNQRHNVVTPNSTLQSLTSAFLDNDSACDSPTSLGSICSWSAWSSSSYSYERPPDEIADLRMQILDLKNEIMELKSRILVVAPCVTGHLNPSHLEQQLSRLDTVPRTPAEQQISRGAPPATDEASSVHVLETIHPHSAEQQLSHGAQAITNEARNASVSCTADCGALSAVEDRKHNGPCSTNPEVQPEGACALSVEEPEPKSPSTNSQLEIEPKPTSTNSQVAQENASRASCNDFTSRIAERRELMSDVLNSPIPRQSARSGRILCMTYALAICYALYCPEPFSESKENVTVDASENAKTYGFITCVVNFSDAWAFRSVHELSESKANVSMDVSPDTSDDGLIYNLSQSKDHVCTDASASVAACSFVDKSKKLVSADALVQVLASGSFDGCVTSEGNGNASTDALVEKSPHNASSLSDVSGVGQSLENAGDDDASVDDVPEVGLSLEEVVDDDRAAAALARASAEKSPHEALFDDVLEVGQSMERAGDDDFPEVGHSLDHTGDDEQSAEGRWNPHLPPKNAEFGPWKATAGSLTLTVALRWLQGFSASPSTTIRHW